RPRDGRQDAQARDRARGRSTRPRRAAWGVRVRMNRFKVILSEAVRSLQASASTTFAATMTVLVCMFLLGFTIALGTWAWSLGDHYKKELVVKVFFNPDVSRSQMDNVRITLASDSRVKRIQYVSAEEGLKRVQKLRPALF